MKTYLSFSIFFLSLLNGAYSEEVEYSPVCRECPVTPEQEARIEACEVDPCIYDESSWFSSLPESDCEFAHRCGLRGIWLPEGPPAFRPFVADPRQITNSVGWRFNDRILGKNLVPVSYADTLPIYRWCDIWYFRGDLQLELEGCLWATFDPLHDSAPLIDADYYVGIPITYMWENWAVRLRGYHISTHIGDEFLLNHPNFHRKNPSIEVLDLSFSNQFTRDLRLYGVFGWICCQDDSFRVGRFYVEGGLELRFFQLGYRDYCNRLYGAPYIGMHFRVREDFERHIDSTYVVGWEWGKYSGLRRKLRIYFMYHDGYALEGQFCEFPDRWLSINASYGF